MNSCVGYLEGEHDIFNLVLLLALDFNLRDLKSVRALIWLVYSL